MKGIATLIRLSKRNLDELRRKQVQLETEKDQFFQAIKKLNRELSEEMQLAAKTQEMAGFYGGFAKRLKGKEAEYFEEIKKVDAKLETLSEEIMIAFNELKKYEIAEEQARLKALEEAKRKETIELDEIAGNQFARQQKEES